MVHLFSSTPPFCTLVANQANPACTGHNCYEWLGAWTTLTGGTTTIADSMHTHYSFCCITSCIVNADNIGIGASSICPLYVSGNTKITGSISTCQNYMYFSAGCLDMTGGDKAAVIEYEPEKFAILKVDESPDTIFNDHGTVKILKNDMCCIKFDCVFNKVTEVETDYNLQLTPYNGNHQFDINKDVNGFSIYSEENNTFDWYVRKIRKGFKNNRWLKNNQPFNKDTFKPDNMNTFESYIIQDVWSKTKLEVLPTKVTT